MRDIALLRPLLGASVVRLAVAVTLGVALATALGLLYPDSASWTSRRGVEPHTPAEPVR